MTSVNTLPSTFIVEGLDRLGKSTLIDGLLNVLGYRIVHHFEKPKRLERYEAVKWDNWLEENAKYPGLTELPPEKSRALFLYQYASFFEMMYTIGGGVRLILDRAWIGEAVYSPLYRGYSGDYVFELERHHRLDKPNLCRLILLTEDFERSKHFIDDGDSFDPANRAKEQQLFLDAYDASIIPDKRIINVTAADGSFRTAREILQEALQ